MIYLCVVEMTNDDGITLYRNLWLLRKAILETYTYIFIFTRNISKHSSELFLNYVGYHSCLKRSKSQGTRENLVLRFF